MSISFYDHLKWLNKNRRHSLSYQIGRLLFYKNYLNSWTPIGQKNNPARILKLQITTTVPNKMNDAFRGSLPASLAAIGAAITPPITSASITCQFCTPIKVKNVNALARVTKNSVKLTVPITNLGVRPFVIRVVVTIGPQPPPPKESRKPPRPASAPKCLNFFFCINFNQF